MEKTPSRILKEYVESQKFESTSQVMEAMKEMFAEVLQQVMICELDAISWGTKKARGKPIWKEKTEREATGMAIPKRQ